MKTHRLQFQSSLSASPEVVWSWMTSLAGIGAETSPLFSMSAPAGVRHLQDVSIVPGQRLFRSRIRLGGILPVDYSDLTLLELNDGRGFVEQSPMGSMRLWRHERHIEPTSGGGCTLTDQLTFQPRLGGRLSVWVVRQIFEHRHRVLRARLG